MLKKNTNKPFGALTLLPIISMLIAPQVTLADNTEPLTTYTLNVKSEQLKGQFQYKGATLAPVAKMSVQYYPTADESQKKTYEYIWYHDGKPIGFERVSDLNFAKGKAVSITIVPKTQAGQEEEKASADIIFRLALDCYRNSDGILSTTVPSPNFDGIVSALNTRGLVEETPGDEFQASKSKMTFTLQADSDDRAKHLFYM